MTIIATDDSYSGEPPKPSERVEATGERIEDQTRRIAAAIAGALEGLVEALDRYDVGEEAKRAMHEGGEISRAAAAEGATQAHTPEMQKLGHGLTAAGTATADAARSVAATVRDTEGIQERAENLRYAAQRVKEEVRVRADAVAESGRRARVAPGRVRHELGAAFSAWKKGLVTSIAMFVALAIFATIALIVLTIALVVGLNELLGDPAGTFVVALLYVVIAGIAFAIAKSARSRAAEETRERMENAREEVRHVARPVRDAFTRGRGI